MRCSGTKTIDTGISSIFEFEGVEKLHPGDFVLARTDDNSGIWVTAHIVRESRLWVERDLFTQAGYVVRGTEFGKLWEVEDIDIWLLRRGSG